MTSRSARQGPPLTFFGFAFLLVFVFATIPAGIYGALLRDAPLALLRRADAQPPKQLRVSRLRRAAPDSVAHVAAKVHYETSLANVDWLHGTAESLLTVTNVIIVLGLRRAFSEAAKSTDGVAEQKVEKR